MEWLLTHIRACAQAGYVVTFTSQHRIARARACMQRGEPVCLPALEAALDECALRRVVQPQFLAQLLLIQVSS